MAGIERNLQNREWLVARLRAEIIGPDPAGDPIEIGRNGDTTLTWEVFRKPKRQRNGEEILWQDAPIKRYGAGILFPPGVTEQRQLAEEAGSVTEVTEDAEPGLDIRVDEQLEKKVQDDAAKIKTLVDDSENYDVSLANAYRPSAMGLSFLADFSIETDGFSVEVECAVYEQVKVRLESAKGSDKQSQRELWFRVPILSADSKKPAVVFKTVDLLNANGPMRKWVPGLEQRLEIIVVSRLPGSADGAKQRLLTVCIVNRQQRDAGRVDELCFFQCGFRITGSSQKSWIRPYPEGARKSRRSDGEEEIIRLLYRDRQTFAVGHGCAASWPDGRPPSVESVWTDCLPTFQTPSVSADLVDENGNPLRVSMRKLAGLDSNDDGRAEIRSLIDAYRRWIDKLEHIDRHEPAIPPELGGTARILIDRCRACLARIEDGYAFLQSDSPEGGHAREAFRLANLAMLHAQLRAGMPVRTPTWADGRLQWSESIANPDLSTPHPTRGYWRAFQVAFLLMSLRGTCDPSHEDRRLVELIWFPTGGGKTEAYLGLTAFTIFFNRLAGLKSGGADVIMRYTLRLLTAQQFQRAGLLFCAMEFVRRMPENRSKLGDEEFRLGMWVGGDATPNSRSDARRYLRRLQSDPESENPFVLLKCPWCGAKFGPADDEPSGGRSTGRRGARERSPISVYGYTEYTVPGRRAETVVFRCNDPGCDFGHNPVVPGKSPLPIVIIDEDIFENPPNLIIGTVDKFALLAWNPGARTIFGIGENGTHTGLPPSLIIQDELHLISGPLGSMVGAYETVIEELCSRNQGAASWYPKIVASTATISRAEDQVRALYARTDVRLFPPSGLEAGDSFFAQEARNEDGTLKPGRLYAGVLAPGHGSLQTTEARVFATLLQYPAIMPVQNNDESERDPWWTLLAFFNSLRELGGAATLLVADARDYLRVIIDRHGLPYSQIRQLLNWEELTSRIRGDKIPLAIQKLEIPFRRDERGFAKDAVEACLASNIIEVGVDISRLSLMAIIGQPKTTSQYIQVSSRVGRSENAPGLVVVAYSQSKPRDRSHYERFRSYHQRLYAQVEPTSVTPFSPPAVDRALHAIIVAAARQLCPLSEAYSPRPFPLEPGTPLRKRIEQMIERRVSVVDVEERDNVRHRMLQRLNEWKAWDPLTYGGFGAVTEAPPLMHPAGSREPPEWNGHSWPVPSSLRDVDATCQGEITTFYNELPREDIAP